MTKFARYATISLIIGMTPLSLLQAAKWSDQLEEWLKSKYTLTKTRWGKPDRVTQPGTVLVMQQDGIVGDLPGDFVYTRNEVEEGGIKQADGGQNSRPFKSGERVYVFKIDVKNEGIHVFVVSVDRYYRTTESGNSAETHYIALIKFKFPQGYLQSANRAEIETIVASVLKEETEASAAPPTTVATITLDQTPDEVRRALGEPRKVIDLGAKRIFVYDDIKVTFQDGRVSDVE